MYSQYHIDFLNKLNFNLEKEGDIFYSDHGCKGRDYKQILFDKVDNKWCLYTYSIVDGEKFEDWEYFDNLNQLKNYLT